MIDREIALQKAFFSAVRNHPHIYDLMRDFASIENSMNISPPYPGKLRELQNYRDVLEYFSNTARSEPSLEMLGVFWKDGNVLVGVVHGISDEVKDRIFERGFSTSGTGLGLFITKLILNRYDGEIRVEDNEPRGVRFVIKIRKF